MAGGVTCASLEMVVECHFTVSVLTIYKIPLRLISVRDKEGQRRFTKLPALLSVLMAKSVVFPTRGIDVICLNTRCL